MSILQGLIVFAFSREIDATKGDSWLRLTDGWMQETSGDVAFAFLYTKQSPASRAMQGKIESKRAEVHGQLAALMPERATGDFDLSIEPKNPVKYRMESMNGQERIHHHHHHHHHYYPTGQEKTNHELSGDSLQRKYSEGELAARLQDQIESMNNRMVEMQKSMLEMQKSLLEVVKKGDNSY